MTANYAPRVNVHADRYGNKKTNPNRLFVLHTSEQTGESDQSAERLCLYMTYPGDRTDPTDGSKYGASYQYALDTDCIWPCTREDVVSYSAAGANHDGIHICFPGVASQTREQWLDSISRAMIRQCAELLADRSGPMNIPLTQLSMLQVRDGKWGICDHYAVSIAFGRSDHTDVGKNFPWDVLFSDIYQIMHPPTPQPPEVVPPPIIIQPSEEDDMLRTVLVPKFAGGEDWPYLALFDSGIVRPLASFEPEPASGKHDLTSKAQYLQLCEWANIKLD